MILSSAGVLHLHRNTPRFQLKNLTYTVLRIIYSILITRKMASGHKSIESDHYKMNAHDLYDVIISNGKIWYIALGFLISFSKELNAT